MSDRKVNPMLNRPIHIFSTTERPQAQREYIHCDCGAECHELGYYAYRWSDRWDGRRVEELPIERPITGEAL